MLEIYSQFIICVFIWFMIFIGWGCMTVCFPYTFSLWHNHFPHFTYPNWSSFLPPHTVLLADLLTSVGVTTIFLVPMLERLESSLIPDVLSTANSHGFHTAAFQVPIISWLDFTNGLISSHLVSHCQSLHSPFLLLAPPVHRHPLIFLKSSSDSELAGYEPPIAPHCLVFNYISVWP